MALTPDDVVTKQFQHVRFKEGLDPVEVDDYLDEIVIEWRKTLEENVALKARIAELEASAGSAAPAAPAAPAPVPAPAPVAAPAASLPSPTQTAGIIELAQRVHDEHVAEGKATRDKLISEAEQKAQQIISDAEAHASKEIAARNAERDALDERLAQLRQFERDYRTRLRIYIEGQLKDLDASADTGLAPNTK